MDGDVVFTGNVSSYPQYVQAAAVAARAVGVRGVRNHLRSRCRPAITATT
jgi:osmotically-inducible protein OsmY